MLCLRNISKVYKDCTAVSECNLSFEEKGFVAITGSSGSGKTTLLNIIGMLDTPTSGEIIFENNVMLSSDSERTKYRQHNIGFVFQDAVMLEQLNVKDNIVLPLNIAGISFDNNYFKKIVKELQIEELINRKINELSTGQKQRIAIARALICKPKILLADEPTGNLDEKTTEDVFNILKSVSKNILVLAVTHNSKMARKYADRLIELRFGKIINDEKIDKQIGNICIDLMKLDKYEQKKKYFYLSWANFKVKKRKMVKVIFVTVLTIIISTLGIAFIEVSNTNSKNVEKYFLDTNLLTIKEDMKSNITAFLASQFSFDKFISDYDFLKEDERIEEKTENYELTGINITGDIEVTFKDVSTINIDSYYQSRLSSSRISGNFLKDDKEIILSSSAARSIYPNLSVNECIGKEVIVSGNYYKEKYLIVGINSNEDVTGKIVSYITVNAAKKINEAEMQKNVSAILYSDNCYSIDRTAEGNEIYIKDSGKAQLISYDECNNLDILYGKSTLDDGEILLSIGVVRDFGILFGDDIAIKDGQLTQEELEAVLSTEILCVANNYAYFKVVGIYNDEINDLSIIVSEKDRGNLLKVLPSSINIYVKSQDDINDITTLIESNGLSVSSPYLYFKDAIGARMSSITYIFLFLVILMILITVLIINTFSKHNILDSTKDIGLLKAIGARKSDILKIYSIESIITGFISSAAAIIIYPLIISFFNYLFENGYINIMTSSLSISVIQLIVILFAGVFLFIFSSFPSLLRSSKIDAIVSMRKIG